MLKLGSVLLGRGVLLAVLATPFAVRAYSFQDAQPYNAKFTFSRVRYGSGGFGFRGGGANWAHDYPAADHNLPTVMSEISIFRPTLGASNVYDLEDRTIFQNPILYMSEPGFWQVTKQGASNLREYLLKGGFIIFDDFEDTGNQWPTFEASFRQVLPE